MPTLFKAPGLEAEVADALRDELMPRNQATLAREQPFYRLPDTANTQKTLNDYIKTTGRQHAARILQTTEANVALEQSYQIVYTNLKQSITQKVPKNMTADKAVIILALGKLSSENGLPSFADTAASLESGELLAALLDTPQTFKGYGGGCGHVSIWSRK